MRCYAALLSLAFVLPATPQGCEPNASTRKILEQLEVPDDAHLPVPRRQQLKLELLHVTLWASWCGPCRAELPYLEKLYQRFRNRSDIAILAFNVDDEPKAMPILSSR